MNHRSNAPKPRPITPYLNGNAEVANSPALQVSPCIIARLHDIVRAQQSLNTTLEDFRCRISGDPAQGQSGAQADLPPQPIEQLLTQIEQIASDNHGRVIDLMSRF